MKIIPTSFLFISMVIANTPFILVDHTDPYYTDPCLESSGELCDFCCLTDAVSCT